MVLMHAQVLLASAPEGACDYIDADVRDPEAIIREAARTLDFTRPTALMLMGILGLVAHYDEARSIVSRLMAALPPGSYLAVSDGADTDPAYVEAIQRYNNGSGAVPYTPSSPEQISRYCDGLEIPPRSPASEGLGASRNPRITSPRGLSPLGRRRAARC